MQIPQGIPRGPVPFGRVDRGFGDAGIGAVVNAVHHAARVGKLLLHPHALRTHGFVNLLLQELDLLICRLPLSPGDLVKAVIDLFPGLMQAVGRIPEILRARDRAGHVNRLQLVTGCRLTAAQLRHGRVLRGGSRPSASR